MPSGFWADTRIVILLGSQPAPGKKNCVVESCGPPGLKAGARVEVAEGILLGVLLGLAVGVEMLVGILVEVTEAVGVKVFVTVGVPVGTGEDGNPLTKNNTKAITAAKPNPRPIQPPGGGSLSHLGSEGFRGNLE